MAVAYQTKQGNEILDCLKEHQSQHMTVDDILAVLKTRGTAVGQTTIYRNLDKLLKQGVVVRFAGPDGQPACFQYLGCHDEGPAHYHLVCVDCGQMTHLQCEYLDELTTHLLEHHQFGVDRFKTVIYGQCRQCAEKRSHE